MKAHHMHVCSTRTRPVEVGPGHGTWPAGWYTVVAAPPPRVHMRGRVYACTTTNSVLVLQLELLACT
jgi:hypothetical protein